MIMARDMRVSRTMIEVLQEIERKTCGRGLDAIHEARIWGTRQTLDSLIRRGLVRYPRTCEVAISEAGAAFLAAWRQPTPTAPTGGG